MSDSDDLYDVTRPQIPEELADQLLSGTASSMGSVEGLGELNGLLEAARKPAEPAELEGMFAVVSAFQAAAQAGSPAAGVTSSADATTVRTPPMTRKLLTGKVLATVGAITLISAGAAAAAGIVPTPFVSHRHETSVAFGNDHGHGDDDDTL
ncbi:MAG: hypothetical protein RLZZ623_2470, partial [Actinomycetota bacterium]